MPEAPQRQIEWNIDTIRTTALFGQIPAYVPRRLWEQCVGGQAGTTTDTADGRIVEIGEFEQNRLTISQSQMRVDFVWNRPQEPPQQGQQPQQVEQPSLPDLGHFGESEEVFLRVCRRFLETRPPTNRIAFAPIINSPVQETIEGYRILHDLLPVEFDPEQVSDMIWQINRHAQSNSVDNARINRINRWSVIQLMRLELAADPHTPTMTQVVMAQAMRLEMDINIVPSQPEDLGGDVLVPVLDELVTHARNIASNGDTP